jgi:hypothetical protein
MLAKVTGVVTLAKVIIIPFGEIENTLGLIENTPRVFKITFGVFETG